MQIDELVEFIITLDYSSVSPLLDAIVQNLPCDFVLFSYVAKKRKKRGEDQSKCTKIKLSQRNLGSNHLLYYMLY